VPDERVDIEEGRRKEIDAVAAKLGNANHFELLGVDAGSSVDEAFFEASRRFHPDRYYGKKLGPYAQKLDQIFKRMAEAYNTLSDPAKRTAYLDANPLVRAAVKASTSRVQAPPEPDKSDEEKARDAERRSRLTKHPYLAKVTKVQELLHRAREHIAKQEYSHAFTQLNLASQVDATSAEVKALLVEVRKKNDQQRSEADFKRGQEALAREDLETALAAFKAAWAANNQKPAAAAQVALLLERKNADPKESSGFAQKAVEAEPTNVSYRLLLARLLEAGGMKALAKRHFDEAVKLNPEHPEVKKQTKRRWPF